MKRKLGKSLCSMLLALAMVIGLMPGMSLTAKAAEYTSLSVGDVIKVGDSFTLSDNIIEVATGGGNAYMVIAEYGDYPLTLVRANVVEVTDEEGYTKSTVTESETGGYYVFRLGRNRYVTNTEWVVSGTTDGLVLDSIGTYQYYSRTDPLYTFSVHEATVAVTGVSLDKTTAQAVTVGDKVAFTATVAPDNATDKTVTWTTSDASVATVADGVVTAVAAGTATITATATNGTDDTSDDKTATCTVTVNAITFNVTYSVVNGTWSDGTTADKTETVQSGTAPVSVPSGMIANSGYTGGSWDTDPASATITGNITFTYTFEAESVAPAPVDPTKPDTPTPEPVTPASESEVPADTTPSGSSSPALVVSAEQSRVMTVSNFVERLYLTALNRSYDVTGRDNWVDQIINKDASGSAIARGFFNSQEFIARGLDNEEFVTILYRVFFDREPDTQGFANWINALENGATRSEVINGFTGSTEWTSMCARFGINA